MADTPPLLFKRTGTGAVAIGREPVAFNVEPSRSLAGAGLGEVRRMPSLNLGDPFERQEAPPLQPQQQHPAANYGRLMSLASMKGGSLHQPPMASSRAGTAAPPSVSNTQPQHRGNVPQYDTPFEAPVPQSALNSVKNSQVPIRRQSVVPETQHSLEPTQMALSTQSQQQHGGRKFVQPPLQHPLFSTNTNNGLLSGATSMNGSRYPSVSMAPPMGLGEQQADLEPGPDPTVSNQMAARSARPARQEPEQPLQHAPPAPLAAPTVATAPLGTSAAAMIQPQHHQQQYNMRTTTAATMNPLQPQDRSRQPSAKPQQQFVAQQQQHPQHQQHPTNNWGSAAATSFRTMAPPSTTVQQQLNTNGASQRQQQEKMQLQQLEAEERALQAEETTITMQMMDMLRNQRFIDDQILNAQQRWAALYDDQLRFQSEPVIDLSNDIAMLEQRVALVKQQEADVQSRLNAEQAQLSVYDHLDGLQKTVDDEINTLERNFAQLELRRNRSLDTATRFAECEAAREQQCTRMLINLEAEIEESLQWAAKQEQSKNVLPRIDAAGLEMRQQQNLRQDEVARKQKQDAIHRELQEKHAFSEQHSNAMPQSGKQHVPYQSAVNSRQPSMQPSRPQSILRKDGPNASRAASVVPNAPKSQSPAHGYFVDINDSGASDNATAMASRGFSQSETMRFARSKSNGFVSPGSFVIDPMDSCVVPADEETSCCSKGSFALMSNENSVLSMDGAKRKRVEV